MDRWALEKGHDSGCSARGGDARGQDSRSTRPVSVSQGPFQTAGLSNWPGSCSLCALFSGYIVLSDFNSVSSIVALLMDNNVTYGA